MPRSAGGSARPDWLHPRRLEYVPLDDDLAVVRVLASLDRGLTPPADVSLVAGAPHAVVRAPILGSVTHRATRRPRPADHLLWRVTFALPLELVECPQAVFALAACDCIPTRLPAPTLSSFEALCRHWDLGPRGASLLNSVAWRRAAALGTAVAVAGGPVLTPVVALASAGHTPGTHGHRHPALYHVERPAPRAHTAGPQPTVTTVVSSDRAARAPHTSLASTDPAARPSGPRSAHHLRQTESPKSGHPHAQGDPHPTEHARGRRRSQAHPGARHRTHPGQGGDHGTPRNQSGGAAESQSASRTSTPSSTTAPQGPDSPARSLPNSGTTPTRAHRRHHHRGSESQTLAGGGLSTISTTPPPGLIPSGGVANPRASGGVDQQGSGGSHSSHPRHHRASGHHRHGPGGHPDQQSISGGSGLSTLTQTPPVHLTRPGRHNTGEPQTPPSVWPGSASGTSTAGNSFWTTGMGSSSAEVALLSHLSGLSTKGFQPPAFLIPIYQAAGTRFDIPWEVLAAINSVETDYGRDLSVSSAGAIGWMQFMPATWAKYGMSVSGHGVANPFNPSDAIFSAARYLAANDGAHNLRQAVFAYNHAQWYVDEVLFRASLITDRLDIRGLDHYAPPVDVRHMQAFRRTRQGVEIEGLPAGIAVHSMTTGEVVALGQDPSGTGPDHPVVKVTQGPLTGRYVYYGQVGTNLVKVGQRVYPGQPIALVGQFTPTTPQDQRSIEIGFSDASGHPIDHRTPIGAWTPSVLTMRRVLSGLVAQKMLRMAREASGGPYSVGNHATAFTQSAAWLKQDGTDCSGFVSWLLGPQGIGDWPTSFATPSIPTAPHVRPGFGQYVTLWNNPAPGSSGHVFIEILGRWFESAGGIGIHEMPGTEALNYISSGLYSPHHPAGL